MNNSPKFFSESNGQSFRKEFEKHKNEQKEDVEQTRNLIIGNKFWSLLIQKMGIYKKEAVDNPGSIIIVFNSDDNHLKRVKHEIMKRENNEDITVIIGYYSLYEGKIKFNVSIDKLGKDLQRCIVHELIHYLQDLVGKYPQMENSNSQDAVKKQELPWEKEAYKLMDDEKILKIFAEECKMVDEEDHWNKYL